MNLVVFWFCACPDEHGEIGIEVWSVEDRLLEILAGGDPYRETL